MTSQIPQEVLDQQRLLQAAQEQLKQAEARLGEATAKYQKGRQDIELARSFVGKFDRLEEARAGGPIFEQAVFSADVISTMIRNSTNSLAAARSEVVRAKARVNNAADNLRGAIRRAEARADEAKDRQTAKALAQWVASLSQ